MVNAPIVAHEDDHKRRDLRKQTENRHFITRRRSMVSSQVIEAAPYGPCTID